MTLGRSIGIVAHHLMTGLGVLGLLRCGQSCGCAKTVPEEARESHATLNDLPKASEALEMGSLELVVPPWLESAITRYPPVEIGTSGPSCALTWPIPDLARLTTQERPAFQCCDDATGHFGPLCHELMCRYYIATESGWAQANSPTDLATILGPVTSVLDAIGRVALLDSGLRLPEHTRQYRVDDTATRIKLPALSVLTVDDGFELELPTSDSCRPFRPTRMTTFHVNRSGLVTLGTRRNIL